MRAVPAPTISDLIDAPARVVEVQPAAVPALLAQIAALSLALASRLAPTDPVPGTNRDTLLTVPEVADLVRQDRAWVWRRARRADWRGFVVKPSRKVLLVKRAGLERWLAQRDR